MRVVVDFDACQCHALCTLSAPEVFEFGEDGLLNVVQETPDESLRDKVEQAIRECPVQCIVIEEE